MPARQAEARWEGTLKEGNGNLKLGSGAFEGPFSFSSRFENSPQANPEELLGVAHAGCFSMALSGALERAGFPVEYVHTNAKVNLNKGDSGFAITSIDLEVEAKVPNLDDATFQTKAEDTKNNCIISKALSSVPMTINAKLVK